MIPLGWICLTPRNGGCMGVAWKNAVFRPEIHFFSDIVQNFCYHHDWTPKRQHFCVDPVARRASGRPPGPIFGPKICVFLRCAYVTPIFSVPTDPTQWDHRSPTS